MPSVVTAPWHTQEAFDPRTMPDIVTWAADAVRRCDADAIMVCGHSGLTVAGAVSYLLRIPVIAVRKEGEESVAGSERCTAVLTGGPATRWVWLDDFIGSGGTFARSALAAHSAGLVVTPIPHATVLYQSYETHRTSQVGDALCRLMPHAGYANLTVPNHGRR